MLAAYRVSGSAAAHCHARGLFPRRDSPSGSSAANAASKGHTNTSVVHTQPALLISCHG